ncbi:hypothetical protein [Paenibacillus qinlingensis]|uniref:Outer membrane protein assembly factor BamB n=1 Tax=Paenibacillus qinlingensis TaxID=1837343 RepID=A0ABU1P066_9BACL|nr:hypothetical protein [Paenibacillus qinlingensis]MDR6553115.1 outer membrane protein assembly factor BamB [Paenibacillus qinlingensis]
MTRQRIQAREINYYTNLLPEQPIVIAAPRDTEGVRAALAIEAKLRQVNADLRIVVLEDPMPAILYQAQGPVFLIGNLADSLCVKELYFRWFCLTDRWYPGPSGFEVRTLLNPLGSGHNIIHLGYSDEDGLQGGLHILLEQMKSSIPHLAEVKAMRLPIPDHEVIKFKAPKPHQHDWQVSIRHEDVMKGVLGYLIGDQSCLDEYARLSEIVVRNGVLIDDKIVQIHLGIRSRVVLFRLLEVSGLVPEPLRQKMTQFIYDWAESAEGYRYVEKPLYQSRHFPRQNHGTIPALALVFASDYFTTHYPGMEEPKVWKETADRVFAPYSAGGWKPVCDGMCHGWWMTQPTLIDYGLMDRDHRFFESGGARAAADCAVAIVNNIGWMPNAGDSILLQSFPGPSLRAAAAYYEDARYTYMHELAPVHRRLYHEWGTIGGLRTFDIGLTPTVPAVGLGVTVVPLDPLIYETWDKEPDLALLLLDTPPSAPIDLCFDKISIRAGWQKQDDYMLIDGLSTKSSSHSYADAMGIHDYARLGVSCIVTEDLLLFPEPESHSLVTVVKDGETGPLPSFAECEAQATEPDGTYYVRLKLARYAGTDWYREIWMRPGKYAVIQDTVVALEDGEYAVEAHFRTPSRAQLNGSLMTSSRNTEAGDPVEFRLQSGCTSPSSCSLTEVPVSLFYRVHPGEPQPLTLDDDPVEAYKRRYYTQEVELTAFRARSTTRLCPGESVVFSHLAQIAAAGERHGLIKLDDRAKAVVICGEESWEAVSQVKSRQPSAAVVITTASATVEELVTKPFVSLPSSITSFKMAAGGAGGFVCGTHSGSVYRIDPSGKIIWEAKLEGCVHDVDVTGTNEEETVFAGHGKDRLSVLSRAGTVHKESRIIRNPSPYPWWELTGPAPMRLVAVSVASSTGDQFMGAAVGCGDMQLRFFDQDGTERWSWWYKEGLPGRIQVGDVDGDGVEELIVGGDIITDQSTCRILTMDGKVKAEFTVEGWTSRTTSLNWTVAGTRRILACGANRGRNLWVYETTGLHEDSALKADFQQSEHRLLFMNRLGGAVSALQFSADGERLAATTSQGFLCLYDLQGKLLHTKLYEHGIVYLSWLNGKFVLVESNGHLHMVTPEGRTEASVQTGVASTSFCQNGIELWQVSQNTIYLTNLKL